MKVALFLSLALLFLVQPSLQANSNSNSPDNGVEQDREEPFFAGRGRRGPIPRLVGAYYGEGERNGDSAGGVSKIKLVPSRWWPGSSGGSDYPPRAVVVPASSSIGNNVVFDDPASYYAWFNIRKKQASNKQLPVIADELFFPARG